MAQVSQRHLEEASLLPGLSWALPVLRAGKTCPNLYVPWGVLAHSGRTGWKLSPQKGAHGLARLALVSSSPGSTPPLSVREGSSWERRVSFISTVGPESWKANILDFGVEGKIISLKGPFSENSLPSCFSCKNRKFRLVSDNTEELFWLQKNLYIRQLQ